MFAQTSIMSFAANLLNIKLSYWGKIGYWIKYIISCSLYSVNIFLSLFVIDFFHFRIRGVIEFFGTDPEGSIVLYFIPTVPFYWLIGFLLCFLLTLYRLYRKIANPDEQT